MIAIVGGGPAGIALATALDRLGIAYDLFETHQLGATWRAVPPNLRVLSPWWTNVLSLGEALRGNPFRKPAAGEYLAHLLRAADRLRGNLRESCKVEALDKDASGACWLKTQQGRFGPYSATVLATGYFFAPSCPSPAPISDDSIRVLHASQISDYSQLEALGAGAGPVVVVGRRVTAGQLLLELDKRGIDCALSLRSPIEYRRHGRIADLREAAYFFWEELQARLRPGLRRPSYPVMDGGRTRELIDSAQVGLWPAIERIENGDVVFRDGRRLRAGAVVLATGYHAVLDLLPSSIQKDTFGTPLHRAFEVKNFANVFLLGYDNLYDHRSRYLRGIRSDAIRLARILALRTAAA